MTFNRIVSNKILFQTSVLSGLHLARFREEFCTVISGLKLARKKIYFFLYNSSCESPYAILRNFGETLFFRYIEMEQDNSLLQGNLYHNIGNGKRNAGDDRRNHLQFLNRTLLSFAGLFIKTIHLILSTY